MNEDIQPITRLSMARFRLNQCINEMQAHEKAIAEHKAALDALFQKRIRSAKSRVVREVFNNPQRKGTN